MSHFTYLLGAGASFHAIPTVLEFEDRIEFHSKVLGRKEALDQVSNPDNLKSYINGIIRMKRDIKHYTSVDSYAKYLSLTGNQDKYHEVKNLLTIFFMLEQFLDFGELNAGYEKDSEDKKKYRLDPRYNNFVVSIMNEPIWPENLKILSWNYDFQMQLACNSISRGLLKYFPNDEPLENYNLVHFNGIAGISHDRRLVLDNDNVRDLNDIFSHWSDLTHGRGRNTFIKFAWEDTFDFDFIKDHLYKTEYLVVIGYSFPFFNRKIDSKLFQLLCDGTRLKKIYFQNNKLNGSFLYNQFSLPRMLRKSEKTMALFDDHFSEGIDIEHIADTDRFFIPVEY